MTQQARDVGKFGLWVEHFEQNTAVQAKTDAAIDFGGTCNIPQPVRRPLIESVRRFQLGESGDGEQLLCKAQRAGNPEYLYSARLFVAEEQQTAVFSGLLRLDDRHPASKGGTDHGPGQPHRRRRTTRWRRARRRQP